MAIVVVLVLFLIAECAEALGEKSLWSLLSKHTFWFWSAVFFLIVSHACRLVEDADSFFWLSTALVTGVMSNYSFACYLLFRGTLIFVKLLRVFQKGENTFHARTCYNLNKLSQKPLLVYILAALPLLIVYSPFIYGVFLYLFSH